ncbi:redox protein [Alcanivorax jadensis T9]|jgi:organic hydroperoxide reductase OsmC/OhrA|uniref:Redox protein n=2 Tax=Alcanivoracaceae TaxID=224372 RepID=A0ABR4WG07_9GAMM|nr:redox protein [Alcanivorax jadensis T9]MBG32918.1 redox protein [Alcanivorax sp.]|tara:strand:+ start:24034 stop:24438 length:405 start_codon:yes stop_codon:yes gene_type:complete
MHLSWSTHGEDHYLWHLADGNEVRVVDGHHGQQEFMEPEEAFIASLASCHLLSFLTEAAREGLSVTSYDDAPEAILGQNEKAMIYVRQVLLQPLATFSGEQPDAGKIQALHQRAHEKCFIAQSVKSEVLIKPRG